eukprot:scaffold910_cov396-Prasinococcus_capsulatus_cf.AAC.52
MGDRRNAEGSPGSRRRLPLRGMLKMMIARHAAQASRQSLQQRLAHAAAARPAACPCGRGAAAAAAPRRRKQARAQLPGSKRDDEDGR